MLEKIFKKKLDGKWIEAANEAVEYTKDTPELERCEFHHLFVIDDLRQGRKNHKLLDGAEYIWTGWTEAQFHCWTRSPDPPEVEIEIPTGEIVSSAGPEIKTKDGRSLGHEWTFARLKKKVAAHNGTAVQVGETIVVPLPKKDQRDITEWKDHLKFSNRFNHWAKIKGEMFKVKPETIIKLDKHYLNGVLYKRTRVLLECPLKQVTENGVVRIQPEPEAYMYIGIPEVWEDQIDGGYSFHPMNIYASSSLSRRYYAYTRMEDLE